MRVMDLSMLRFSWRVVSVCRYVLPIPRYGPRANYFLHQALLEGGSPSLHTANQTLFCKRFGPIALPKFDSAKSFATASKRLLRVMYSRCQGRRPKLRGMRSSGLQVF